MREHTRKIVDVLGIDVSVMRSDKAVNITMNYLSRKEIGKIFFHTAASSLYCEAEVSGAACINNCDLVLPGDQHMEYALAHKTYSKEELQGNSLYADAYLKRLLDKLNKESKEVYTIFAKEDYLNTWKEYVASSYPQIVTNGDVYDVEREGEGARIVNEINANIPDLVFVCLPADLQIPFLQEFTPMMNTHLIICIESLQPLVLTETEQIPAWVKNLHIEKIYLWMKQEGKFQQKIIGSMFKRSVLDNALSEKEDSSKEESEEE